MAQQTQVERVVPRWQRWLERWPTVETLAAAPAADVIREWQGLGYNRRALSLHRAAQHVAAHGWPEDLTELPGVGRYTADAVASFAFGGSARGPGGLSAGRHRGRRLSRARRARAGGRSRRVPPRLAGYHPADARCGHHRPADPPLDPARAGPAARHPRPARTHSGWPLPEAAVRADGQGAVPEAAAREGVESGDRAYESRARERDAEARAAREATPRSAAGTKGDVAAHARGACGAARDAGAAGRSRARGDEPPDAPPAREAAEAALARTRVEPRRWARRTHRGRS